MENAPVSTSESRDVPAALAAAVDWVMRWRAPLLLVCLFVTVAAFDTASRLIFDRSVEGLFHHADPRLISFREDMEAFGDTETVFVAYDDAELFQAEGLKRLERFHAELRAVPGVVDVLSLARARLPSAPLSSRTVIDQLAAGAVTTEVLRRELLMCDIYRGRLVSPDGNTTMLLVSLARSEPGSTSQAEVIARLREICAGHDPPAALAGGAVIVEGVYSQLEKDGRLLGIASSLVLGLAIALLFRNLRWMLLPLAVVQVTLIWTKALLVVGGMRLSMVSSPLVALVTVIGVATIVHIAVRFREERVRKTPEEAMRSTLTHVGPAVFWTSFTTALGFASLMACRIVPVAGFGAMMALGSALVFVAAALLTPGAILVGGVHTDPGRAPAEGSIARFLRNISAATERHPRWGIAAGLVVLCIALAGIPRLEVATAFEENFRKTNPIIQSYRFLSEKMGTTAAFDVLIDAPDVKSREEFDNFLERIREFQADMKKTPGVTGTLSAVDILDFVGGTRLEQAPLSERLGAMLFLKLSLAERMDWLHRLEPKAITGVWNPERRLIRIIVQTGEVKGADAKQRLIETIEWRARQVLPAARTAGAEILLTFMVRSMLTDQWITFGLALTGLLAALMIAFRDWRLGLVAMIPNATPILIVLGVMGWAGLRINLATAMLSSVSVGIAVDCSIHYLYRFRLERRAGVPLSEALHNAHGSVGLAMVLANVALIAGFSTLTLSTFIPTIHFGILVSVAMFGGLIGNLFLLPMLLRSFLLPEPNPRTEMDFHESST